MFRQERNSQANIDYKSNQLRFEFLDTDTFKLAREFHAILVSISKEKGVTNEHIANLEKIISSLKKNKGILNSTEIFIQYCKSPISGHYENQVLIKGSDKIYYPRVLSQIEFNRYFYILIFETVFNLKFLKDNINQIAPENAKNPALVISLDGVFIDYEGLLSENIGIKNMYSDPQNRFENLDYDHHGPEREELFATTLQGLWELIEMLNIKKWRENPKLRKMLYKILKNNVIMAMNNPDSDSISYPSLVFITQVLYHGFDKIFSLVIAESNLNQVEFSSQILQEINEQVEQIKNNTNSEIAKYCETEFLNFYLKIKDLRPNEEYSTDALECCRELYIIPELQEVIKTFELISKGIHVADNWGGIPPIPVMDKYFKEILAFYKDRKLPKEFNHTLIYEILDQLHTEALKLCEIYEQMRKTGKQINEEFKEAFYNYLAFFIQIRSLNPEEVIKASKKYNLCTIATEQNQRIIRTSTKTVAIIEEPRSSRLRHQTYLKILAENCLNPDGNSGNRSFYNQGQPDSNIVSCLNEMMPTGVYGGLFGLSITAGRPFKLDKNLLDFFDYLNAYCVALNPNGLMSSFGPSEVVTGNRNNLAILPKELIKEASEHYCNIAEVFLIFSVKKNLMVNQLRFTSKITDLYNLISIFNLASKTDKIGDKLKLLYELRKFWNEIVELAKQAGETNLRAENIYLNFITHSDFTNITWEKNGKTHCTTMVEVIQKIENLERFIAKIRLESFESVLTFIQNEYSKQVIS